MSNKYLIKNLKKVDGTSCFPEHKDLINIKLGKNFLFYLGNDMFENILKLGGCKLYGLSARWDFEDKFFEIENSIQLTRKYYIYHQVVFPAEPKFLFRIHHDGFSPFMFDFNFFGIMSNFMVTEYHFNVPEMDYNFKKNRSYNTEELILINRLGKKLK